MLWQSAGVGPTLKGSGAEPGDTFSASRPRGLKFSVAYNQTKALVAQARVSAAGILNATEPRSAVIGQNYFLPQSASYLGFVLAAQEVPWQT